jgi:hypothetical protein
MIKEMKPFNLDRAIAGGPLMLSDGSEVTQFTLFNVIDHHPIRCVTKGVIRAYTLRGKEYNSDRDLREYDLFMAPTVGDSMHTNGLVEALEALEAQKQTVKAQEQPVKAQYNLYNPNNQRLMEWQPIETAPRDNEKILLLYRPTAYNWGLITPGIYNSDIHAPYPKPFWDMWFNLGTKQQAREWVPTHWMYLPEPPTSEDYM